MTLNEKAVEKTEAEEGGDTCERKRQWRGRGSGWRDTGCDSFLHLLGKWLNDSGEMTLKGMLGSVGLVVRRRYSFLGAT